MPSKTKTAKPCVAAAAQVKKKAFNNSSFFKATLKVNNKALALEVNALKKTIKMLEMSNMFLLKENQMLKFALAIGRHKERRLMVILKDVQSLYSPDDDPSSRSEEYNRQPVNTDNIQMQRGKRTGLSPPKPLSKKDSQHSTSTSVKCHGGPTNSTGIESDNTGESPSLDHPSSMAMAAAEQENTVLLDTEMELTASESTEIAVVTGQSAVNKKRVGEKAVPVHHVAIRPEACPESGSTGDKPPSLTSAHALDLPSSMAMAAADQENTVLLDAELEMTASDSTEITVTGQSAVKSKRRLIKEKTRVGKKAVPVHVAILPEACPGRVPLGGEDIVASDKGALRPRRTCNATIVDYKDPPINCKMRRGDRWSDIQFLSSPIFKTSKKKKPKSSNHKPLFKLTPTEDQLATQEISSGLEDTSLLHLRT